MRTLPASLLLLAACSTDPLAGWVQPLPREAEAGPVEAPLDLASVTPPPTEDLALPPPAVDLPRELFDIALPPVIDMAVPPIVDLAVPPIVDLAVPPIVDLAVPPIVDLALPPVFDLTRPPVFDLAVPPVVDLARPPIPDLSMPILAGFVVRRTLAPTTRAQFALDLNGDGKPDNQLGNIMGALASQGLGSQPSLDVAAESGSTITLLSVGGDTALQDDPTATFTLYVGQPTTTPDFGGAGLFAIDATQLPSVFTGALKAGQFSSVNPLTTGVNVRAQIAFEFVAGSGPILLPLSGAQLTFQRGGCPVDPVGETQLDGTVAVATAPPFCAQLHGGLCNKDAQITLIPGIALELSQEVASNPGSPSAMQILQLFDVGNGAGGPCVNPNGSLGEPGDGVISSCEVADNQLVAAVLAPDVQLFTDVSCTVYKPNPANTTKDSLSVGLGLDLVPARLLE